LRAARESGEPLSLISVSLVANGAAPGKLVSVLRSRLRHSDRLCRLDAQRFVVVAQDTDLQTADALAADLRRHLQRAELVAADVPAGVVAGDVMIASIAAEGGGNFTAPSGWSSTNLFAGATKFGTEGVYFHVAGSSEPASYSWGMGSSPRKATGMIASYVGVENSAPIEVK